MKIITPSLVLAGLLVSGSAFPGCGQDQYGNQWNYTIDSAHKYLYGYVVSAQGCDTPTYYLTGSYYSGGNFEMTAANPLGDADICFATFKLKGKYPNFAWYYDDGYGAQESTFVSCGSPVAADVSSGGALR